MGSPNGTVSHKQLHRVVYERLLTALLAGTFEPGEWLRQKQIADQLGVSQMPVREALRKLAAEGVVEHVPYRGVRVLQFSACDVGDLYAQRSYLEGRAAEAAAGRISLEELAELRLLLAQMGDNLTPETLPEYRRLNQCFHRIIYTASRRSYLVRTLDQLWSAFPTMLLSVFSRTSEQTLPKRRKDDLREHAAIIAALERRDAEETQRLMRQHIESAGCHLSTAMNSER